MSSPPAADTAPRRPVFHTVKRFWPYLAPYRGRFVVAGIALLVAAGCAPASGEGLKRVIDPGVTASHLPPPQHAPFPLLAAVPVLAGTPPWRVSPPSRLCRS